MISLLDLNAQYNSIKSEVNDAIKEVLEDQNFIMGDQVKKFESNINSYIGSNFAYGCASGSDALLLALMAIDIEPGDYVITSPFTFFATAGAISRLGAIPIFIDIEYDTFNIDPKKIRDFLEGRDELSQRIKAPLEKIKAIIPVHLYGQMADMDPIMGLANEYNLYVIEDAAQSIGAKYKGKAAGTIGDFGCFSFFPSKNLGAYGDAGLITVKDPALAEKVDVLRLHGARPKYHHKFVGINSRLDTIQAAVLQVKLKHLDKWSVERSKIAQTYNELFTSKNLKGTKSSCSDSCKELGGTDCSISEDKVILPVESHGSTENNGKHIYHQYTLRVKNRDKLSNFLKDKGIGNAVYYPKPLHLQECFSDLGYKESDCPIAVCASEQAISLPVYPELKTDEIKTVVDTIIEFISNH
jgi:dTDP-4-amino-4,6-dideoxygalactose transaminase